MDSNNGLRRGVLATFAAKRDSLRRSYPGDDGPVAPSTTMAAPKPAAIDDDTGMGVMRGRMATAPARLKR